MEPENTESETVCLLMFTQAVEHTACGNSQPWGICSGLERGEWVGIWTCVSEYALCDAAHLLAFMHAVEDIVITGATCWHWTGKVREGGDTVCVRICRLGELVWAVAEALALWMWSIGIRLERGERVVCQNTQSMGAGVGDGHACWWLRCWCYKCEVMLSDWKGGRGCHACWNNQVRADVGGGHACQLGELIQVVVECWGIGTTDMLD